MDSGGALPDIFSRICRSIECSPGVRKRIVTLNTKAQNVTLVATNIRFVSASMV